MSEEMSAEERAAKIVCCLRLLGESLSYGSAAALGKPISDAIRAAEVAVARECAGIARSHTLPPLEDIAAEIERRFGIGVDK